MKIDSIRIVCSTRPLDNFTVLYLKQSFKYIEDAYGYLDKIFYDINKWDVTFRYNVSTEAVKQVGCFEDHIDYRITD
jgi:hypothetical protein